MSATRTPLGRRALLLCGAVLSGTGAPWHAVEDAHAESFEVGLPHAVVMQEASTTPKGLRLLGALKISSRNVDGYPIAGLSGLGWDDDDQRLYAVSDSGIVFVFVPKFTNGELTGVLAERAMPLRSNTSRPVSGSYRDAEGLALDKARNGVAGDAELVISFERFARVNRYTTHGRFLGRELRGRELRASGVKAANNRSLESVGLHPTLGMIVGLEQPEETSSSNEVPLLAKDGSRWRYPLLDVSNSSLTAMEPLPDGSVLTLERGYGLLLYPLTAALRIVADPAAAAPGSLLQVRTLARLSSAKGHKIDNFEGLARHTGNRFFIVSDDNNNALQSTLLIYFELPALTLPD